MSEGERAINPSGTACRLCGDDSWHAVGSIACEARELANLRAALAAAQLENEALRRCIFPDLDAREPGLTRIRDWRCGDTGTVRYAEHSTRGWRVSIPPACDVSAPPLAMAIPADVFAWLIRPMMASALNLIAPAGKEST
jgi:hypothetical protein